MNKSSQKGFAHLLLILILLAGLVAGVYLVGKQTVFKPKASREGTRVEIIDKTTNQLFANGVAATRNVKLKLTYVQPSTPSVASTAQPTASAQAAAGQQTFQYELRNGVNVIGIPIQEGITVQRFLTMTSWDSGSGTPQKLCSDIRAKDAGNPADGVALIDRDTLVPGWAFQITCTQIPASIGGKLTISMTGTPFTETPERLKARIGVGTQWISLATDRSYSDANEFLQSLSDASKTCTRVRRGGSGGWTEIRERTTKSNPFNMNDPKEGFEVVCQSSSTPAEEVAVKIEGAVALFNSSDKGADRFTKNECAGEPFKTGAEVILNDRERTARWDCQPMFYLGSTVGERINVLKGIAQRIKLTPPPGYKCVAHTIYGERASDSFDANSCTVTVAYNQPADSFIWFKLQPSNVQGVSTAFAQTQQFPTHFRVSNDQNSLSSAQEFAFSGNPTEIDWELSEGAGQKTVYAQFKVNGSYDGQPVLSDSITLAGSTASGTASGSASPSPNQAPSSSRPPVARLAFDEGTGQRIGDGNSARNGILGLSSAVESDKDPVWKSGADCVSGSCLDFSGPNVANQAKFVKYTGPNLGDKSFTFEVWVKKIDNITGNNQLIVQGATGERPGFNFHFNGDNQLDCGMGQGTDGYVVYSHAVRVGNRSYQPAQITDNNWHHLACAYNVSSKEMKIYGDGQLVDSAVISGGIDPYSQYTLFIGSSAFAGHQEGFRGLLDEIRIYDYERTPAQIQEDMNSSRTPATVTPGANSQSVTLRGSWNIVQINVNPTPALTPVSLRSLTDTKCYAVRENNQVGRRLRDDEQLVRGRTYAISCGGLFGSQSRTLVIQGSSN